MPLARTGAIVEVSMSEEFRGRGIKLHNTYAQALGPLFADCPKAVFAAIAVSALTTGGERLDEAKEEILREWTILYDNGIVQQKPPSLS